FNPVRRPAQAYVPQFIEAAGGNRPPGRRQPVQRVVVKDDGPAVAGSPHIDLYRIASGNRRLDGARSVLDDAAPAVVQAAMGNRPRGEPAELHGGCTGSGQATSNTASISTVTSSGRLPEPTAIRACLPRSPSTSTIRSEQPFITLG